MESLLEVSTPGLAYICLGGFVVLFSTFSLLVREKVYVNEVVLGTGFGILVGPLCAGIIDPRSWSTETNRVTLEIMRVVLATGLFAIGVELPKSYIYDHAKGLLTMVVPTMAVGWIIVAGLLKALFGRFSFVTCLALAACLTPTDPVISAAIVGGNFARKHVPVNIRRIISAEAAANDGLAYPFLSISLFLTVEPDPRKVIQDWIFIGWLYEVVFGILVGTAIGFSFSHIMKFSHKRGYVNHESYVAQYLALAVFTMGLVNTLGSDDLLAAFAAGSALSWDGDFNTHTEGEAFAAVIEYILNCGCFFYIGAWFPWSSFTLPELGITPWRLSVLCVGILFLRRIPAILVLYKWIPEITNWREALFCGHFGPMGVGAIFISTLALHHLPPPHNPPESQEDILATALHPVVGFVVLISIVVHGLSIPFFNVGRNIHSHTVTLTSTLDPRTFGNAIQPPDWLLYIRRLPASLPLHNSVTDNLGPQIPPPVYTRPGEGGRDDYISRSVDISPTPNQPCGTSTPLSLDLKVSSGHQTPILINAHGDDDDVPKDTVQFEDPCSIHETESDLVIPSRAADRMAMTRNTPSSDTEEQ